MSSNDVRSILNIQAGSSSGHVLKRSSAVKRPDGISRELYALIGANSPSLLDSQPPSVPKYREKPKLKLKAAKWEKVPFIPAASDNQIIPRLSRWSKQSGLGESSKDLHFSQFNRFGPSVMAYSQFEYDQHLADADWTAQETAYLFDLLRQYDLRFVVVADRYEYVDVKGSTPPRKRSVEDIKDRYYTICRRLVRTRTASDAQTQQQLIQAYSFDKARETKRKQYSSGLFHLTASEIAEEEALFIEVKRMEQNGKRFRAERDDLMRNVVGFDSGLYNVDQSTLDTILGADKAKKRKRPEDGEFVEANVTETPAPAKKAKDMAIYDNQRCIYRPFAAPGGQTSQLAAKHAMHQPATLRSTKMPVPKSSSVIRVTEILSELGINAQRLVMPTRANIDEFESLLQAVGALVDIKRQVDRVEQEVRALSAQREGFVPPIGSSLRDHRSESVTSSGEVSVGRKSRQ